MGAERPNRTGAMGQWRPQAHVSKLKQVVLAAGVSAAVLGWCCLGWGQQAGSSARQSVADPPRVAHVKRFLVTHGVAGRGLKAESSRPAMVRAASNASAEGATARWEPLGPTAVVTANYGRVTGRISALALDPADSSGNTLYVGTTGGGVWVSSNAATSDAGNVKFTPLTDRPSALASAIDASISIGALTVQPGGTGVILAGTGDPNDGLDSYYGSGVLRSGDGGKSWTLIAGSSDVVTGLGAYDHGFRGEGFAGFAWSTVSPQVVVAAVSQAYEGVLVGAELPAYSYSGLYYSTDAGATWHLSRVTDDGTHDVQGPMESYPDTTGNPATAVVWNPLRKVFIAAVRFHGFYQSADGVTWTRLASQPGGLLTMALCPTNGGLYGSPACPLFRAALAVNPQTGDTYAWSVDGNNQDQGLWQDLCNANAGACANTAITFSNQVNTAALRSATMQGSATILNGDYNLVLAAVPADKDTVLLAGANDLWKCSVQGGCNWRNVTNAKTCMSARVGAYQHAVEWNAANPLEVLIGNDSGLWRSEDGIAESGAACAPGDADHFDNLNGGLGSLAEIESMSQVGASPYTMMIGLGANGTAGVKSATGASAEWPQILGGAGGPVAIDPTDPNKWYANNGAGVSIHVCSSADACTTAAFGELPVISDADVGNDGLTMTQPAPFLLDAVDATQVLVATCRLWRGPVAGGGWTGANAITPMLGSGTSGSHCAGNSLIRSVAAMKIQGGGEVVYVGTYGTLNGGADLPGHVLKTTMTAGGTWSGWTDTTLNPVPNDSAQFNAYGLDVSSIAIDPHDASGNTVYVTIAGMRVRASNVRNVYRTTDGGAHWMNIMGNLPGAATNVVVVDPVDANTVYLANDIGVYATQKASTCGDNGVSCWSVYGTGLPEAPVTTLSASPASASPNVLVAGTYGRGVWQIPLLTAGQQMTTATVSANSLTFVDQAQGTTSEAQTITLTNMAPIALATTRIATTGDFEETDNCKDAPRDVGNSCAIQVTFSPTRLGTRTGGMTIEGNLSGGNITIALSGTGVEASLVNVQPTSINFGNVETGSTSADEQITVENAGDAAISMSSMTVAGPFAITGNSCGTTSLAAHTDCQMTVVFKPAVTGAASGALTVVDSQGMQKVQLTGTGTAPAADVLSPSSLSFPATIMGVKSVAQTVTLTNSGGNPLTKIAVTVSGAFQQTSDCTMQLAANASCSIDVLYLPTAEGAQTGTLTVSDILKTQTVALSGTGLLPPVISVSPTSLSFEAQPVGVKSAPQTVTVSNTGGAAMNDVGFQIAGVSGSNFATGATSCGAMLDKGKSCTVQVSFTATANGTAQAMLTVTSSTLGVKAVSVALSGNGASAAGLKAQPSQLMFPPTAVGQNSPEQTVTVTNSSQTSAAGLALTATGPFNLTHNQCGTTLAAGASCIAGVVFSPLQTGSLSGALMVASSTVTPPATVALNGTGGLTGMLQVLPAQVNFPMTGVGTASGAIAVTLTNISAGSALTKLVLATTSSFRIASTTCGASLAAQAQCTANVAFAPAVTGQVVGQMSITASELQVPAVVPLSGMGYDFAFSMSGPMSQTVASGQTASYTISVAPAGGSGNTFTFECGALPQFAGCTFDPSSLSVAGSVTGQTMLQIATTQSVAEMRRPAWHWTVLPVSFGLLLAPLFLRRRRGVWMLLMMVACVGGVSSCASAGGGGGSTPSAAGRQSVAAGTYVIPVTITSNGVQHGVSLTLVVE